MPTNDRIAGLKRVVLAEVKALGELSAAGIRTTDFPRYDAQQQRVADAKADLRKATDDAPFPDECEYCGNIAGLCICQHPVLFQVAEALAEKGIEATYEYPGYVAIAMPDGRTADFGTANVDYTANWSDCKPDEVIDFFMPETATVDELVTAIEGWLATQALTPTAKTILTEVIAAMQNAEEIWGPEDYVPLMQAIAAEANQRIATYIANHGGVK